MAEDSGSGGGHETKYLETLNFVVNFLHEEGFLKAHGVLLAEFSSRLSSPAAEGVVFAATRHSASACSAPPSPLEYSERALEALSPPRSKSAQPGPSWEGFQGPSSHPKSCSTAGAVESAPAQAAAAPKQAPPPPPAATPVRSNKRRPSRLSSQRQRPPWDGEADDYESMDDPGYNRRDVPSQTRFTEAELDACSEDGSERAYFMHQPGDLNYDDVESEVSASDLEGITAASSVQSGGRGHGGGSGGGGLSHSHSQSHSHSGTGDAHDETWDLGPTDIKFAEPVSTPSKSPEKLEPDARRPVLSRVESLSSSFKDFEMERGLYADCEGEGQVSSKVSDAEYVSDAEAIDFPVPVVSHEDVELFQQKQRRPSPTSSMDVAAGSLAPSVAPSVTTSEPQPQLRPFEGLGSGLSGGKEQRAGGGRRKASAKGASLLKALSTGNGTSAAGGGGGAGGFSFPVTPPSDEPDQRLFTSWPSVRSSCTSEPVAMSDDDGALPAEYADDEYSRYRLSSRSTSLAAQDFASAAASAFERKAVTDGGEASPPPRSPDAAAAAAASAAAAAAITEDDVALEWEFKPPVPDRLALLTDSREPSLEFSTPNSDDEGVGTPTAAPTPSGGNSGGSGGDGPAPAGEDDGAAVSVAGDGLSDEPTAASVGAVEDVAEAGALLDAQVESVTLAGEVEAREAAAPGVLAAAAPPLLVLQPPRLALVDPPDEEEEEGAVSLSGPLAVGPLRALQGAAAAPAEALERKDSSLVVAHQINFELEDLATEQSGVDTSSAGAFPALDVAGQSPSPRSPDGGAAEPLHPPRAHQHNHPHAHHHHRHHRAGRDQEAPAQGHGSEEGEDSPPEGRREQPHPQHQQQPSYDGGDEGGDDAGAFGEGSLYDGEEADVDEPPPGDGDGLEEQLSSLVDDRLDDDDDEEEGEDEEGEEGGEAESGRRRGRGVEGEVAAWGEEERLRADDNKDGARPRTESGLAPRYHMDEQGNVLYEYEESYIEKKYEVFELRIIHRRHRTGFEETKDFPIRLNDLIAGRYQVMDFLGSAAFSRAVQALDVKTGQLVCLKIIKNNKDYFDQSLDEIKLLKYVNTMDPNDEFAVVRLYDFFYYKEHLFLVCELLRANLYEFQKYNKESGDEQYFTNARIQRIARQALRSLAFLHSLGLIHSDLKPENILIKSYSRCEVKVIDLGSSCFITDQLSSYVQSRSYRAPEVILGLPYDYKVDVWSLGCILAELSSGYVLFQNDSLSTLLARLEGILGPIPEWMLHKGRYAHRFYTRSGMLYERSATNQRYELLVPKRTSLRHRMPDADEGLLEFVAHLLTVDPRKRPTAADALKHPWLQQEYASLEA